MTNHFVSPGAGCELLGKQSSVTVKHLLCLLMKGINIMAKLLIIIEYEEGCGYNCKTVTAAGDEFWASRRPFNRVEMQNRINRFVYENPGGQIEQEMVYSQPFPATLCDTV